MRVLEPGRSRRRGRVPAPRADAVGQGLDLGPRLAGGPPRCEAGIDADHDLVGDDVHRHAAGDRGHREGLVEGQAVHHDRPRGERRGPLQEGHGRRDGVLALPRAGAVPGPARHGQPADQRADAAGMDDRPRRLGHEGQGRPAEEGRALEHPVHAVLVVRALLTVVEHGHRRRARGRRELEHRQDGGIPALHVGRAPADDAVALPPRRVAFPRRHRVQVADQRRGGGVRRAGAGDHGVAQALDSGSGQGAASPLDRGRRARPPGPVTLGTSTSSRASAASGPASNGPVTPGRRTRAGRR